MSKFRNLATSVVVSVSDDKDGRFGDEWVSFDAAPVELKRPAGRPKKSE